MTAATTTRAGLALNDTCLNFGDGDSTVHALDHVTLEVAAGELVAIVGPSGAGKSSLLAVAGGLTRPTSGTVTVDDVDLTDLKPRELTRLRRERIGFVFQSGISSRRSLPATSSGSSRRSPDATAATPTNCSNPSAWVTAPTVGRGSCRAANASASASPGH